MSRTCLILLLAVLVALGAACGGSGDAPPQADGARQLREAVTTEGVMEHLRRFAEIAKQNGGNRAAGTPGYDASARYVAQTLRGADYDVTVQTFEFPFFEELSPARLEMVSPEARPYKAGGEVRALQYSGSGDVTAPASAVDLGPFGASTSGCEASDFGGFRAGDVALLERGTCPFGEKARNAESAGASAVVIFDGGAGAAFSGTLGRPGFGIPVVAAGSAAGEELARRADNGGATVRVVASTRSENRETTNVLAESPGGRADRTVMAGAHLDSVPVGPGINDNGSGSATVLEIAEEMGELGAAPRNKVRFAFWGAEELGLFGSSHYVEGLSERVVEVIELYMILELLGSANV